MQQDKQNFRRTACAALVAMCFVSSAASARIDIKPTDSQSNNKIDVTTDKYVLNGSTVSYDGSIENFYGGETTTENQSGNTITIRTSLGGTMTKRGITLVNFYGGRSTSGSISNTSVDINLADSRSDPTVWQINLLGKFYATYSESGTLSGNSLTIRNWDYKYSSQLVAHQSTSGDVTGNSVTLIASTVKTSAVSGGEVVEENGTLVGAKTTTGRAEKNSVTIRGEKSQYVSSAVFTEVSKAVYGAQTNNYALGNTVTIGDYAKTLTAAGATAATSQATDTVFDSNVVILNGTDSSVQVMAGALNAYPYGTNLTEDNIQAKNNVAKVQKGYAQTVYGALVNGTGTVTGNQAIITGGTVGTVVGGSVGRGVASGNVVTIDLAQNNEGQRSIRGAFIGGESMTGDVKNNTVTLEAGSTVQGVLVGGQAAGGDGSKPEIAGNKVVIRGTYTGINDDAGTSSNGTEKPFWGDSSNIPPEGAVDNSSMTADLADLDKVYTTMADGQTGLAPASAEATSDIPTSEQAGIFGAMATTDAYIHDNEVIIEKGAVVSGNVFASYHNGTTKAENNSITVKEGADVSKAKFYGQNKAYIVDVTQSETTGSLTGGEDGAEASGVASTVYTGRLTGIAEDLDASATTTEDGADSGSSSNTAPEAVMTQNSNVFKVDGFSGTIGKVSGFETFDFVNAKVTDPSSAVITITDAAQSDFADTTVTVSKMTLPASTAVGLALGETISSVKLIATSSASGGSDITFKYDENKTFDVYMGTSLSGTGRLVASNNGKVDVVEGEPTEPGKPDGGDGDGDGNGAGGNDGDTGNGGSGNGNDGGDGDTGSGNGGNDGGNNGDTGSDDGNDGGDGDTGSGNGNGGSGGVDVDISDVRLNAQTALVSRARAASLGFLQAGWDLVADKLDHVVVNGRGGSQFFGAVYGTSMNFDVAGDLDIEGVSAILGWGFGGTTALGDLALSVFYEYSRGDFTTTNTFGSSTFDGSGDVTAHGGGVAARLFVTENTWVEAALRAGRLSNEMNNTLMDGNGSLYGYDTSSTYIGGSVGLGHRFTITDAASFELSARYMLTHVGSDDFMVGREKYTVDSLMSQRVRAQGDWHYAVTDSTSITAGLALEHEFGGEADMHVGVFKAETESIEGTSASAKLGFRVNPASVRNLSVDGSVRGYAGQRRGVTGTVSVIWAF